MLMMTRIRIRMLMMKRKRMMTRMRMMMLITKRKRMQVLSKSSGSAVSNYGHEPGGAFGNHKKVRIYNSQLSLQLFRLLKRNWKLKLLRTMSV